MLLLLGAASLAPFVGSFLLYFFWQPQNFTNYGELIPALPLAGVTIPVRYGEPLRVDEFSGKWIFLMTDSGRCDDYCRSKLYVMRQIRLTQGKARQRIERVWVISDGAQPPQDINLAYRGTRIIHSAGDDFLRRLPAPTSPRDHIYLVDPFGNLMMRFPRNADPQRMKKDIDKLIKISDGWVQTGK